MMYGPSAEGAALVATAFAAPSGGTGHACFKYLTEHDLTLCWRLFAGQDGSVDIVASDHSPSTPDVKLFDTGDFLSSWGGFAGLPVWNPPEGHPSQISIFCETNTRARPSV